MFDSETVAFVGGERCIFHESGIFSQVQLCSSSILRGNFTVSTVPGLCDREIWHFLVACNVLSARYDDLAGICKGKTRNRNVLRAPQKKRP